MTDEFRGGHPPSHRRTPTDIADVLPATALDLRRRARPPQTWKWVVAGAVILTVLLLAGLVVVGLWVRQWAVHVAVMRDAVAKNNEGLAYYRQKQYAMAIAAYDEAIRLNPQLPEAYSNRGLAFSDMGDHARGIEDCSHAIQLNPRLGMAYNNRGLAYFRQDKL
ncbi:MAG TPA: tetratricopeptide repeat protein, partial [Gemmataceae bacterium]|nr:tetratricopeptide repeat protein [Gemmataceae bacterium]